MRSLAAIVVALSLSGSQAPQPPAQLTPQECVKAGRDFAAQKQREAAPLTAEIFRAIDAQRADMVKTCGARFDLERATVSELPGLVDLYIASNQRDLAQRALDRGLAANGTPTERADLLAIAVRLLLQQPKSPARNAKAETYVDALDAMPDSVREQKTAAHISMNNYYRGDDIDAGIIKHSTWLIEQARQMTAEQRKKFGSSIIGAYVNMAEAFAGQGENDRAIELLKRAESDWPELPTVVFSRTKGPLARYLLVGTSAPALDAPAWLNRDPSAGPLNLKGKVTLLQFTAHWCGPCKESYPGMQRLRARFKDRPFQELFVTRTYGYFENERNLVREDEIARDRTYFAGYGFDIPIAIGPALTSSADGRNIEDPMETAFAVGGIPQINLIDAKGRIRLIMIGYDDANEEKLASFIEKVLAEK